MLIYRLLLSPFILIYGIFMTMAGFLFPIPLLMCITMTHLVYYPFILLLNKAGSNITAEEPFINIANNYPLGYIVTITIPVWGMFAIVVYYVKTGKVWGVEE